MNLSKVQQEVINELKNGGELVYLANEDSWLLMLPGGFCTRCKNPTAVKLLSLGLIQEKPKKDDDASDRKYYQITQENNNEA